MAHMTETEKDDLLKYWRRWTSKFKKWMTEWVKTENKSVETKDEHAATVATFRIHHQPIRLSGIFSGDSISKSDMTYDLWKYEVKCLQEDRSLAEEDIRLVIRRSLKGEAAHVLKRLGHNVFVKQILANFDGVYGVVETGEETLAEFYSTKQHKSEDVSTWGCRLEEMWQTQVQ